MNCRELARLTRNKPDPQAEEARRQLADAVSRCAIPAGKAPRSNRSGKLNNERGCAQSAACAMTWPEHSGCDRRRQKRAETARREQEDVEHEMRGLKRGTMDGRDDDKQANNAQRARLAREQVELAESMRRLKSLYVGLRNGLDLLSKPSANL